MGGSADTMAGYGGLDGVDTADWGPGGEMGGQKRSYFMWVNSKLMEGGYPTIGFDSMYEDVRDGIVFAHLIRTLSNSTNMKKFPSGISGIEKRPLHPLAAGSNFNLLWSYLNKVEKIRGGTSGLPVPSMMKGDPTYTMGAIFKLMQHYTIGNEDDANPNTPAGKLLEWVKPRCVPHKDVKNFGSSWKDGKAIVALWNYLITEDADLYEWLKQKLSDCGKYGTMCDTYKDSTHDNLDVKLEELRKFWGAKKLLETTLERYKTETDTITTNYNSIIDKTIRSFDGTKTHRQRRENMEKGREEVITEISKILPYQPEFEDIETKVTTDEDRDICKDKAAEVDTLYNFWLNDYDRRIKDELDSDKYRDEEEVGDLLAIYHKFSVDLDTIVSKIADEQGQLIPAADPGISTDYNEIKSRLHDIASKMQDFQAVERDLRAQVQAAVDEKFDNEGLPGKTWYEPNYEA